MSSAYKGLQGPCEPAKSAKNALKQAKNGLSYLL
jgi:hypothetical protein